ncbi:cytochrome P450 [Byssothecium circinans]|uniref:Cytochrome P450 n=1 Tax=Byssothecium circinans TaxID=147558 RepID=A0A6A5TJY6_9PLEO|nr:cytochrome P450 [Byssothecium circinans]
MYQFCIAIFLSLSFLIFKLRNVGCRPKDYPPGPPTIPILGNLHLMPKTKLHEQFKIWGEEYGPVYSLILGTSVMIVLSSDQAIKDLLDKRSNIYSSRPGAYIPNRMSGGKRMALMEYGKLWRSIRSHMHEHLSITASKSYVPYQDLETRSLLVGLLNTPDHWIDHLRLLNSSTMTQMLFGFRTTDLDDAKMHQLYTGFGEFGELFMTPAAQLLDCFPLLQWLPDALVPIKRKATEHHIKEKELYLRHWMTAKEGVKAGTIAPCIAIDFCASQAKENFSDDLTAYIISTMLEAGSDTTWSEILGWVQAMVLFPSVAKTAQEEIDRVCGERLPTLDDEPQMQYIRGCVKESLRFMPTTVMGVPHAVIRDDMYMGWRIPKDASVVMNVWGMHNDPSRYPNPRTFDPTRYTNDTQTAYEAAVNPDSSKRDHFIFGAGRRICAGLHIAERTMFLSISRLLWAFNFELPEGETTESEDLTEGLLVHPRHVPVRITVRSEERTQAVRREWEAVRGKLDESGQWKSVPEGMFARKVGLAEM